MANEKCIIILSEKSSGSSACQNQLAKFATIRHVDHTRHFQNETLFWTKAASALGLPQTKMVDSEVPIPMEEARVELATLLHENLRGYPKSPLKEREEIFLGWERLCHNFAPIFLEKSPHHLCQWSALELIVEFLREYQTINTLLIGLIRNPMDTVYSQYKRWKSPPEEVEQQWIRAYKNLLKLKEIAGINLVTIRYEDMVTSLDCMRPVFEFCGVKEHLADKDYFHKQSIQKWKNDRLFGFSLSHEAMLLAQEFGYHTEDLQNESTIFAWPAIWRFNRASYKAIFPVKRFALNHLKKKS